MLAALIRVVNTLISNQVRQPQVPQEARGRGGDPSVAPIALVVETNTGSQLLKDFMAFQPPAFYGGTDATVAENWMLSIEKHLRSIGYSDNR